MGVNALIIVHEWGHFVAARMCGVRCDKFYIWFDAWGFSLIKFKWGDTVYGLGWLPLGGYIKMLGQEDNPGAIKEEIERAKLKEGETKPNAEASPVAVAKSEASERDSDKTEKVDAEGSEEPASSGSDLFAPDSYLSKPIWQRMIIISGGVAMNVVFAFLCAIGAYLFGVDKPSCSIGGILPGEPAWIAGVQPGDECIAIKGEEVDVFEDLTKAVQIGDIEGGIKFEFERQGEAEPVAINIEPRHNGLGPVIGVISESTTSVFMVSSGTPAAVTEEGDDSTSIIQGGDVLVEAAGIPIEMPADYDAAKAQYIDQPLLLTFERPAEDESGTPERYTVELAPRKMKRFGIIATMGPIAAIQVGSPAEEAGLEIGDVILAYDGEEAGDPLTLHYRLQCLAREAEEVELTVLRGEEELAIVSKLEEPRWLAAPSGSQDAPWECAPLGLCYKVLPVVSEVMPGSPAEEAGVAIGSQIEAFRYIMPRKKRLLLPWTWKPKVIEHVVKEGGAQWPALVNMLQLLGPEISYEIVFRAPVSEGQDSYDGEIVKLTLDTYEPGESYYVSRGITFEPDTVHFKPDSAGELVSLSLGETWSALSRVYGFLRHVGGQISPKAMGGPIAIVKMAYGQAASGPSRFLLFLCLISANLAVVNFLPIPVLDGGHIVFLCYEAVFRRPPNEKVQIILSYIGLAMILALTLWVVLLDTGGISRY
jgi:regulator of sigma E protease